MIYTIQNEFLTVGINSLGAEKEFITSNKNVSYLRKRDEYWDSIAPLLFPNVGRLKEGYTFINNERYELELHGFARKQEFEVLHQKKDEITLFNSHSKETLKHYPFEYKLFVTYTLKNKTLTTKIRIVNHSMKDMPFNYGGHPGFRVPLYDNERFEDYEIHFEKPETFHSPTVEKDGTLNFDNPHWQFNKLEKLQLDYRYFTIDAIVIPRVQSNEVSLVNKEGKGIRFSFADFVSLALWTKPNASFICLEPWIGYADLYVTDHLFSKKDNIINLEPLKDFTASYAITILD